MTKKTERVSITAKDLKVGDEIVETPLYKSWVGSTVLDVKHSEGDFVVNFVWEVEDLTLNAHLESWAELKVERAVGSPVEGRVQVKKTNRVDVEVDQECLGFVSEGELVKVYLGDCVAILSRSEWDQIVGAL